MRFFATLAINQIQALKAKLGLNNILRGWRAGSVIWTQPSWRKNPTPEVSPSYCVGNLSVTQHL